MKRSCTPNEHAPDVTASCDSDEQEIVAGGESEIRMRQSGERVHGPYQHFTRWRLIVDRNGKREKLSFGSEAEANNRKRELLKEIWGRSVSDAVRAHSAYLRERGLRSSSVERAEAHLRRFFELDTHSEGKVVRFANWGGFLEDLREKQCEALYAKLAKAVAVDTHRNALVRVKTFGKWCVKQGWLRKNPAE